MIKNIIIGIAVIVIGLMGYSFLNGTSVGSAISGLNTSQRIATTTAVGPDEVITIFAKKKQCSSRIISTTDGTGQAIQILFADPVNGDIASASLSETVGHYQAGTTTVVYDSGTYGCGKWVVFAAASTTLMLSEFE